MTTLADISGKLARNPLGLIALFVVAVDSIAGFTAASTTLSDFQETVLIFFIVGFPVIVFASFVYLVVKHPAKLYAPADFADQAHFMEALGLSVKREVERVAYESEGELAALDIELVPIWEANSLKRPDDSWKKLELLETWTSKLEQRAREMEGVEKAASVAALRRTYNEYLQHARRHFASGPDYQRIRERIMSGLEQIKNNEI